MHTYLYVSVYHASKVIGVSACWDFTAKEKEVEEAVQWTLEAAEHREEQTSAPKVSVPGLCF